MNAGLLTSTFVGNVGVGLTLSKPAAARNTGQFAPAPADNHANAPEPATTDNTFTIAQNKRINKPPQEFRYTLRKKTIARGPQKGQVDTESEGQSPTSPKAEQPGIVQSWLAQYPLVEHGKKGVAREMGPKAGYELAQLLANLRTGKSSPGTGPTAKPVAKEPFLTTDKSQLGLKGVLPDSSRDALLTHTQPAERKNAGKIQLSSKTLITTKGLINQQGGKKLTPEMLTTGSKTAVAGEKTAIADGQDIAGGRKTPVSNDSFPAVQDKSAPPQQKVPVDPEKSTLIVEKPKQDAKVPDVCENTEVFTRKPEQSSRRFPTSVENKDVFNSATNKADTENKDVFSSQTNKADTPQRSHPGTPGLSELTNGSGKEYADNPSGKLLLQNLNQAQGRISTGQTKDNRSSTAGNSSNSNFEQVLSNNAQTPIAEQTPASAQTAKAAGNASPQNAFPSVSEQLQESMHSSLRQGDQQLTIRLNPPELGRVFIRFQGKGNQITGLLEVDRAQTRYEIEQALPQIIRNLAECGVQVKRLEVVLTNQQEQHAFKEPSLAAEQDAWFGQQAGAERNNPNSDTFGTNEWLTDDPGYSGYSEPQEMLIADDFVDVLV